MTSGIYQLPRHFIERAGSLINSYRTIADRGVHSLNFNIKLLMNILDEQIIYIKLRFTSSTKNQEMV